MNQATKQKIINEAEIELYPISEVMSDREWDVICAKRVGYITGATKYAELLEQEKAKGELHDNANASTIKELQEDCIVLRKSLAHETTQRIFDNEKANKLVEALEDLITYPDITIPFVKNVIEKALTEYKK